LGDLLQVSAAVLVIEHCQSATTMHGIEYQQSGQTAKKSFWHELFFANE
jgi:hypothetical protein